MVISAHWGQHCGCVMLTGLSIQDGVAAGCISDHAGMRQHCAFWDACGPGCVAQGGYVCGLWGDVGPWVLFACLDDALQADHLSLHPRRHPRQPLTPPHAKHNLHANTCFTRLQVMGAARMPDMVQ